MGTVHKTHHSPDVVITDDRGVTEKNQPPSPHHRHETKMPKTRSTTRNARHINGSPLSKGLSPRRRSSLRHPGARSARFPGRRHVTFLVPEASPERNGEIPLADTADTPLCSHDPTSRCACGNPTRPASVDVESKNYTMKLLQQVLDITAADIDVVGGFTNSLHGVLVTLCQRPGVVAEHKGHHQWRILQYNQPIPWHAEVGRLLSESCCLSFDDISLLDVDPYSVMQGDDGPTWEEVNLACVDLRNGTIAASTIVGKAFICYAFIPALFRILELGGLRDLVAKLWATSDITDVERTTNYFVYHLVNRGFGKLLPRKRKAWEEYITARKLAAITAMLGRHTSELSILKEAVAKEGQPGIQGEQAAVDPEWVLRMTEEMAVLKQEIAAKAQEAERGDRHRREETEKRFGLLETKVEHAAMKIGSFNSRVEIMETRVETVEMTVDAIESDVTTVNGEVKSLGNKLEIVENTIESHTAELNSLHDQQQLQERTISQSIDSLKTIVQENFMAIRGSSYSAVPTVAPQPYLFFRVRECSPELVEDLIPDAAAYRQIFTNETNRLVSRSVTTALAKPFLIAVMGYSGAGKTHTAFGADGLFPMIIQRLPPVTITVYEILTARDVLQIFEPTVETAADIAGQITKLRATRSTQANAGSSRTHLVIIFNDLITNTPYGLLADIAGYEEAENMAMLNEEMAGDSRGFAKDNMFLRKLLEELVLKGRRGFISRKHVSVYKRVTTLNREISAFLGSIDKSPALRVVLCASAMDQDLLFKTAWKDMEMWDTEEDKGEGGSAIL